MRVLITNHALAGRAGTELYVRDLALALRRRGHHPLVYSPFLGEVAEEIRAATVPVVDDLRRIGEPPDVIHGHHHLEVMAALTRFPQVPAVAFCHGWLPWQEAPLRHPRIVRWVAVDEVTRQRLVDEGGIDPARIEVHPNFVDLQRFRRRAPLPARPRRALVFSNYLGRSPELDALRAACEMRQIELSVVGAAAGKPNAAPESMLGEYDVVFAKGRAALEALAVGCAVVVCDAAGLGPLVTEERWDRLRQLNFGQRALSGESTPNEVGVRLDAYDPDDSARVTDRAREEAGLEPAVDRLLDLYSRVSSSAVCSSPADDSVATADYLRWLAALLRQADGLRRAASTVEVQRQGIAWLEECLAQLRREVATLQRSRDEERERGAHQIGELDRTVAVLRRELMVARQEVASTRAEAADERRRSEATQAMLQRFAMTRTWKLREALLRTSVGRWLQRLAGRR